MRLVQTDRGLVEVDPTHCPNGHELEGNMSRAGCRARAQPGSAGTGAGPARRASRHSAPRPAWTSRSRLGTGSARTPQRSANPGAHVHGVGAAHFLQRWGTRICHTATAPPAEAELTRPAPGGWGGPLSSSAATPARHQRHRQPPRDAGACLLVSHFLQRRSNRMCHRAATATRRRAGPLQDTPRYALSLHRAPEAPST